MKISSILVFNNGNLGVFDEKGEQIPELQRNLITAWAEFAESKGFCVGGIEIEIQGAPSMMVSKSEGRWCIGLL